MDERALYETLLDRPDDPSIALVFADWLQERADPMAEFFALQAATERKDAQRAQDLLIMNWRRWFGPLATVLRRRTSIFQHGFLKRAEILLDARTAIAPLAEVPQLASVRSLVVVGGRALLAPESGASTELSDRSRSTSLAPMLGSRWLKNLRVLECEAGVLRNTTTVAFRLERLKVSGDPALIPTSPGWAALELLEVECRELLPEALSGCAKTVEQRLFLEDAVRLLGLPHAAPGQLTYVCEGWRFTPREAFIEVTVTAMNRAEVELVNTLSAQLEVTGIRTWRGPASQLRF